MVGADELRQRARDTLERVIARGEDDLIPSLIDEDFFNHEAEDERSHGQDGFAATGAWLRSCFGQIGWDFHQILVDGDTLAAHVTMRGTHEGGLPPGAPATHKPFEVRQVHLLRFGGDGRALEHWAVRDDLGVMLQAGLLGPPGAPR